MNGINESHASLKSCMDGARWIRKEPRGWCRAVLIEMKELRLMRCQLEQYSVDGLSGFEMLGPGGSPAMHMGGSEVRDLLERQKLRQRLLARVECQQGDLIVLISSGEQFQRRPFCCIHLSRPMWNLTDEVLMVGLDKAPEFPAFLRQ